MTLIPSAIYNMGRVLADPGEALFFHQNSKLNACLPDMLCSYTLTCFFNTRVMISGSNRHDRSLMCSFFFNKWMSRSVFVVCKKLAGGSDTQTHIKARCRSHRDKHARKACWSLDSRADFGAKQWLGTFITL